MRNLLLIFSLLAALSACNNGKEENKAETRIAAASTEEKKDSSTAVMPDSLTQMKNWELYMTPGEMHKMVKSWNGSWNAEMTMWMNPGGPAEKQVATMVNKTILGDRYQQGSFRGNFNGRPFEGLSTLAFDNHRKLFLSTWIDNMGTGLMEMEGPWDPTTRTMTLTGKMVDPMVGREVDCRETYKVVDDNFHFMEMFVTGADGKEFKTMEVKYTRQR